MQQGFSVRQTTAQLNNEVSRRRQLEKYRALLQFYLKPKGNIT